MIGYSCKYAPLELIAAYGGEALMLDAETEDFSRAETLTHANVCCHAKALLLVDHQKTKILILHIR